MRGTMPENETRKCEFDGETRGRRGPKPNPNATKQRAISLKPALWDYIAKWPGENDSHRIAAMLEYVILMQPEGASPRKRDARGRFCK